MSTSPRESHTSDTEGGERPLRERLRNATIKGALQPTDTPATSQPATETARATLHRKRSHEDVESVQDEPAQKIRQARKNKRSRDNSPEDKLADHSTKRKSDEIERDVAPVAVHVDQSTMSSAFTAPATEVNDLTKSDESPKSKRSRVEDKTSANTASEAASSTEEAQIPSVIQISTGSGFGNTSAASPFASLAASKSPSEQPSNNTSAFATSAFGALASSSTSAFGALGQTKNLSSFASPTSTPAPGEDSAKPAPTASIFGGTPSTTLSFATAGSSGFGSGASGFGKLGNGFGGLGGSKLTSFASSGTPGVIGGGAAKSSARAFGAPADDDDEEQSGDDEDGDAEVKSPKPLVDEDKKDDRFFEQDIETGEENEITTYTCRAKLYNFVDKKEWKERGLGVLRLNVSGLDADDAECRPKARLVMRADGSHRVILNTPIQKSLKFGDKNGDRPTNGYLAFMGTLDGKPNLEFLQLKAKSQSSMALWDHIAELQEKM